MSKESLADRLRAQHHEHHPHLYELDEKPKTPSKAPMSPWANSPGKHGNETVGYRRGRQHGKQIHRTQK